MLHLQQCSCTGELAAIEECRLVYSRCCRKVVNGVVVLLDE